MIRIGMECSQKKGPLATGFCSYLSIICAHLPRKIAALFAQKIATYHVAIYMGRLIDYDLNTPVMLFRGHTLV